MNELFAQLERANPQGASPSITSARALRSLRRELALPVGNRDSPPSMRISLPVMNAPSGPMRSAPTTPTSSGMPPRPAAESVIMRRYPSPRGLASSSLASGVKMMPGLMVLTREPRLTTRSATRLPDTEAAACLNGSPFCVVAYAILSRSARSKRQPSSRLMQGQWDQGRVFAVLATRQRSATSVGMAVTGHFRCADSAAWSEIFDHGAPECISACSTENPRT